MLQYEEDEYIITTDYLITDGKGGFAASKSSKPGPFEEADEEEEVDFNYQPLEIKGSN